jgi:hypothetical protein
MRGSLIATKPAHFIRKVLFRWLFGIPVIDFRYNIYRKQVISVD